MPIEIEIETSEVTGRVSQSNGNGTRVMAVVRPSNTQRVNNL